MPEVTANDDAVLVSHTGMPFTSATTLRFTLDVTADQHQLLLAHADAFRLASNHHLARVRANLEQRAAERSYGIPEQHLTPALSWSKVSFINQAACCLRSSEGAFLGSRVPQARLKLANHRNPGVV